MKKKYMVGFFPCSFLYGIAGIGRICSQLPVCYAAAGGKSGRSGKKGRRLFTAECNDRRRCDKEDLRVLFKKN